MTEKKLNEISYNVIEPISVFNRVNGFVSEMDVQVVYKDLPLTTYLRCDLFVENCLVVELKSVLLLRYA